MLIHDGHFQLTSWMVVHVYGSWAACDGLYWCLLDEIGEAMCNI